MFYRSAGELLKNQGKCRCTFSDKDKELTDCRFSLLMRAIVMSEASLTASPEAALPNDAYSQFGKVIFTQLAELRHRGAFSTVAQTFTTWCIACSSSRHDDVRQLPLEWYKVRYSLVKGSAHGIDLTQDVLACIQDQSDAITRRSAGLPSMVVAILSSRKIAVDFDRVILDLQAIAQQPATYLNLQNKSKLPQVHALNCLKDIFTDSALALSTEPHMETTLGISVACLESDV